MRSFAHLCAVVLMVPQLLLFAIFAVLEHITGGRTLGSLFTRGLDVLAALFGWAGALIVVTTVALLAAGFSARTRVYASAFIVALWLFTTVSIAMQFGEQFSADQLFLFVPGVVGAGISGWLLCDAVGRSPLQVRG